MWTHTHTQTHGENTVRHVAKRRKKNTHTDTQRESVDGGWNVEEEEDEKKTS